MSPGLDVAVFAAVLKAAASGLSGKGKALADFRSSDSMATDYKIKRNNAALLLEAGRQAS